MDVLGLRVLLRRLSWAQGSGSREGPPGNAWNPPPTVWRPHKSSGPLQSAVPSFSPGLYPLPLLNLTPKPLHHLCLPPSGLASVWGLLSEPHDVLGAWLPPLPAIRFSLVTVEAGSAHDPQKD